MSVYALCLVAVGVLAAGHALSQRLNEGLAARELIERVPLVQVGDHATGWVRITGRVRPSNERLRAPWSGRDAVFIDLHVGAAGATAGPRRTRRRVVTAVDFEIDDGTGRALVRIPPLRPGAAEALTEEATEILTAMRPSKRIRRWGPGGAPAELQRLMARFGLENPGELPFTATERIIAPGDELTVAGYATWEPSSSGTSGSFRSMPTVMVLEASSEHAIALASPRALGSWWGA
jgi:hypothetical protein